MRKTLSKAERENIIAHAGLMAPHDYDGRALKAWIGDYEATTVELEAERDSLRRGADGLIDAGTAFMKERNAALAERDELRRHLKALGNVADAVAAMP